jgi:flagellar hook protein FlgE
VRGEAADNPSTMISIFSAGLSGMQAAQVRLSASAHNVANSQTEGFRRQTVQAQTEPSGGAITRLGTAPVPGEALATDLVDQRLAQHLFTANLRTVQAADRMLGSLLDAVA